MIAPLSVRIVLAGALSAASLWALVTPVTVQAQETAARSIEEIIVTARRREESLQDVPISITALSGAELDRIGISDLVAVGQAAPNVTLEVSRGTNTTLSAFIRGVGQQDPVAGFEAGVGLYVDDVYLNRPQAAVLDIYDVERIEVLRGPQGTLYGRNTIGGAIKYVSKRLADETQAKVRLSAGSFNQLDGVLTASTSLSDTVRVGGALAKLTRDGFGDNLTLPGVENYQKDIFGVRGSLEWTPSDNVFVKLAADYIDDQSDPRQGHRLTVGNVSGAPVLDDVFDTRAGLNNPDQEVTASGVALTTEWTLNDQWMIRNILAYREDESFSPIDFDSLAVVDLDVPVVYENDQLSEELQLLYTGDRLNGMVGAFYMDANAFNAFDVILGQTGAVISLPGLNAFTLGDVDTSTWAIFGDFTYDLTDTLSLSVGGRYTSDERSSRVLRETLIGGTSEFFGGTAVAIATTSDFEGSETFTEFTPRISLGWRASDTTNVYFTYSEGFKGGSFDPRALSTGAPDIDGDGDIDASDVFEFMLFQPETVDSFEVGVKGSWFDDRVIANLAVFQAQYSDVQIPGSVGLDTNNDGIDDSFVGVTSNAADADITGAELEGTAYFTDTLSMNVSVGYMQAVFNEFIDAFGNDVASQRVFQNTPDWTAQGRLNYQREMPLFGNNGDLSLSAAVSYRSAASQFEVPNPLLDQPSFNIWDASAVWSDSDGHWTVGLHGKNLADEEYKVAGYFFPTLGLESSITAFYGNPRTFTATLDYRF
ncbi:MAG: TonB-dependent receptor [Pseudomonadota bacterium]